MSGRTWHWFEAYGIELEYMIVDQVKGSVLPACDVLMESVQDEPMSEYENGDIAWSNELVLHVVELKTNGPTKAFPGLTKKFLDNLSQIRGLLKLVGGNLMPTGMHPLMDPGQETRLWPHENGPIYRAYDKIFGCNGHGWSNVQSCHINLPFAGDHEFAGLHAAIRAVLPILPALAASTPLVEGRADGLLDYRLEFYRKNQAKIPQIAGDVVPETVNSEAEYRDKILAPMYKAIAKYDREGLLQHEWLNSRGAIARFDRGAIEIRTLDLQEHPAADLGIAWLCSETVKALAQERFAPRSDLQGLSQPMLAQLFVSAIKNADRTMIEDPALLRVFGWQGGPVTAITLWKHLRDTLLPKPLQDAPEIDRALQTILDKGCLARRILAALGPQFDERAVQLVYAELMRCLEEARSFRA